MPQSTAEKVVNGDSSSYKIISHLNSYPVVSEGTETFKSNPYGKKSLEIADSVYARFGKPVEPYLETPYSYAKPYVNKADEFGDSILGHVDSHFPIVKDNTETIIGKAKDTAFWPYKYLSSTWQDEYSKTANHNRRGAGVTTSVLALVSLELRVASDFFHYVADNLKPAYEDAKNKADELTKTAQDKAGEYEKYGKEKYSEVKKDASKKADEAGKKGDDLTSQASKKADELTNTASKKADEFTNTASKKADEAKHTANHKAEEAKHKAQK